MNRILITGKNCELSRHAFAAAARQARAIPYPGAVPGSVAGGSRRSVNEECSPTRHPSFELPHIDPEPPQPRLGVDRRVLEELGAILLIFVGVIGCMLLAALP